MSLFDESAFQLSPWSNVQQAAETLFVLHQLTGHPVFRQWGWDMFQVGTSGARDHLSPVLLSCFCFLPFRLLFRCLVSSPVLLVSPLFSIISPLTSAAFVDLVHLLRF